MTIDAGASAVDRAVSVGKGDTVVSKENPANADGKINYIAIYCPADAACDGIQVASFSASGNDLTTRAYVTLDDADPGLNEYTAPEDFAEFEIHAGDYIGIYIPASTMDADETGGSGIWGKNGDYVPCSSETFTSIDNWTISLYATGYQLGQINIGDNWKDVLDIQINVGDAWKQVIEGKQNIGDVWKNILY